MLGSLAGSDDEISLAGDTMPAPCLGRKLALLPSGKESEECLRPPLSDEESPLLLGISTTFALDLMTNNSKLPSVAKQNLNSSRGYLFMFFKNLKFEK
jgi:hypothetical protein